jgi:orotate phosphoribosyltransferase
MNRKIDFDSYIALAALKIKAVKLNPENPFTWASGYKMPIYNDNRMFLFNFENRDLITDALSNMTYEIPFNIIAGTSTAGIAPATSLANKYKSSLIYIRDKPKDHGLKNQIEGIDSEKDLNGYKVVLIEDLISTGGSSVNAVQGIRNARGQCNYCLSIFNYGFDEAIKMFNGEIPFNKEGQKLDTPCFVKSVLSYDKLLSIAIEENYINSEQEKLLLDWRKDPFGWGEKNGFPKVEKSK